MTDENFYDGEFHPYDNPARPHPLGENVLSFRDGKTVIEKKPPEETSSIWKGARKILALPDETIQVRCVRKSGVIDYTVNGTHVSSGHGKEKQGYLCHKHAVTKCAHTKRMERWREEQETK